MSPTSPKSSPELSLVTSRLPSEGRRDIGSLPAGLTSFIGREAEIAEVLALLRKPEVRLVTLTGPGGVGKTRLAIKAAEIVREEFEDGVWFVTLASVHDPALVPLAIARELRLRAAGGPAVGDALKGYLRARHLLLILDNLEHLLDAKSFIAELLQTAPALTVLVTSRSVLHLYGEHRSQVHPMPVASPDSVALLDPSKLSPAVRLFCERAAAADSQFELTPQNAAVVAEICHRLDGLTLAIELAASRIDVLTPEALAERLGPRLSLLVGGKEGQPERFSTMRSAIAWSYDLLDSGEQWLLRNLSVFVGGFTMEAAEAVVRPFEGDSEDDRAPLDQVSSLVEKSLLWRSVAGAGMRFSMLGVIQEYCLEELKARNELEAAKRRHCEYVLALVQDLGGAEMAVDLVRLESELPNIRAALTWAFEGGQTETALQLAVALYSFWGYHGHMYEGQAWLLKILKRGGMSTRTRVDGLLAVCGSFAFQGDYQSATLACQEAADLAESGQNRFGRAMAQLLQGIIAEWQGDYRTAAAIYGQCSARIDDFGETYWGMRVGSLQAEIDVLLGDLALGERSAREAVAQAKALGYLWVMGSATAVLAYISLLSGDLDIAAQLYQENLTRYQSAGDLRGMGGAILGFAGIALECGHRTTAAQLVGAAHATGDEMGVAHLGNKALSEQIEERVRASLSPAAFQGAWDTGYALGREWAVAEAHSLLRTVVGTAATAAPESAVVAGLTRREIDVLYLLARRLTDKEIADALSISHRTAMHHVSNLLSKLELDSRRKVPKWADEHGLV